MRVALFAKRINGTYYMAEAIGENKKKRLWITSLYYNSKVSAGQMLHGTNALSLTSENGKVSSADTDTSLARLDNGVNTQTQNSSGGAMKQARDNREVTDRELLADAMESIAENQAEREALEE